MAKWGEGDPRWIVEERPDATNVNNWHWTEKNACAWSQDVLKRLLVGCEIEGDIGRCIITDLDSCEGEAVVNNRKGKLIFFYEWDIVGSWQGRLNGTEETIEGKVTIPNLSEENDVSEIEVIFTLKNEGHEQGNLLKQFLYNYGKTKVRDKLQQYIKDLKEEYSKGLILPKKGQEMSTNDQVKTLPKKVTEDLKINTAATDQTKIQPGFKIETKTLKTSQTFQCTGPDIYNALTLPELVSAFTNGPVKLDPRKGGKFELFGGNIHGTFEELVQDKQIVQKWRTKRWPPEHYSTVSISIEQQNDNTRLNLVQTGIPESEYESTKENWDRYYWDSIKRTLGFGSFL